MQSANDENTKREWRAGLLRHRPVVNARTVEEIGSVADVVFDPDTCQVAALAISTPSVENQNTVAALARRAFGGVRTISYVPLENILALNSDVVMVDLDPAHPMPTQRLDRLPHLTHIQDLAVITLHGLRLGRLVDLLLDAKGSRLTGYLINPTRRGAVVTQPLSAQAALPSEDDETDGDEQTQPTVTEALPSNVRLIPASPRVRVGRALILVIEDVEPLGERRVNVAGASAPPVDPFQQEDATDWQDTAYHGGDGTASDGFDAPTQQLRH